VWEFFLRGTIEKRDSVYWLHNESISCFSLKMRENWGIFNDVCKRDYYPFFNFIGNINELFAFSIKNDRDGTSAPPWNYLNWDEEFARQGVSNEWKESNFNSNYSYCDTYPEKLWLPEKASTQMLIGSCRFLVT